MRSRSRRVFAAVALLFVLGSCSSDRAAEVSDGGTPTPATTPPTTVPVARTMVMVGDSITNGSETQLREQLATLDVDVSIDAEDGRRMVHDGFTSSGLQAIQRHVAQRPDLWVIALGTNDVANLQPPDYLATINELLAAIPAGAPVLWVDCYLDGYQDLSEQFDAALRQVLATRGNARVVDWATVAAEDGVLRDGIHPSGFGIEEFTRRVSAAVADWSS